MHVYMMLIEKLSRDVCLFVENWVEKSIYIMFVGYFLYGKCLWAIVWDEVGEDWVCILGVFSYGRVYAHRREFTSNSGWLKREGEL